MELIYLKMQQLLRRLKNNWRTNLIGLFILTAFVLWISKIITTDDFIKVATFASGAGFFLSQDSKKENHATPGQEV
jgi:hypothetical protein